MDISSRITGIRALSPTRLLPLVLSLTSCGGAPPALAVGDVSYSDSDLLTFDSGRRTRLAELTAFGMAVSSGEIEALGGLLLERRGQEALLERLEEELALQFAGVAEEALQARYEANPEYELTVRHLVVLAGEWASEEEEEGARSRARAALERIRSGEAFSAVAADVSEEPGAAERGGLLQPGRQGSWVEEFWQTASTLEVGEVSRVIRTPYGFHVLKLEDRDPVPFPEARGRVVEEVAGLIPPQTEAFRAWVDSVTAPVRVDSLALGRVWEETGSLLSLEALLRDSASMAVATWPGGSCSGDQLRAFLASLERPEWEEVSRGGLPELLGAASHAARRFLLLEEAQRRGVALGAGRREALVREWESSVAAWAQGLGFGQGMSVEALKAAAMEGVASSGQGARIARDELHRWGPMLLSAYPIEPAGAVVDVPGDP